MSAGHGSARNGSGGGLRPQTWQGWAVMIVIALIVVLVAVLSSR